MLLSGLFAQSRVYIPCKGALTELRNLSGFRMELRQCIEKVLHQCVICKRQDGVPFRPPRQADLPSDRVKEVLAFTHVDVYFAGSLFVKTEGK